METKEKLVKKYTESLIQTMMVLSCKERNSLERIDNIQYYFSGLKLWIIDILKQYNCSNWIVDEINQLSLCGGIDDLSHTIDFRFLSVKINELVYLAVGSLENNLEPLITKLHDFNHILDESLNNHKLCGC